jgi:hypothetical protein
MFTFGSDVSVGGGAVVDVMFWGSGSSGVSVTAVALAGALVAVSVANSRSVSDRSAPPYADRYATTLFDALPPHAVVFIWPAELTQPLIYRQVVAHDRQDVVVVASDGLVRCLSFVLLVG